MKKLLKKWSFVGLSLIFIVMTLTGCSGENKDDKTANKPEEKLYPITIEGQEILLWGGFCNHLFVYFKSREYLLHQ